MNDDEDFKRIVIDYITLVEPQRYHSIMATLADIKAGNDAILAAVASLVTSTNTALADLAAVGAAGGAAILDQVAADQKNVLTTIQATESSVVAAIAATPLPKASSSA